MTLSIREKRELEHFESLAKEHGYDWWGYHMPASKERMERRVAILKNFLNIRPQDKVLECGCGSGDFTSFLSNALSEKIQIFSIDISESQLNIASKKVQRSNVKFSICTITNSGFEDNFFDYVIGNSILHHLEIDVALREIKRVLKSNGKILFFEPNMMNPQVWLSFNVKPFRKLHEASPDERAFHRWEIGQKLSLVGFRNITVKPFDFMHPVIPKKYLSLAKVFEKLLEKTFLNEIAGSLIVFAEK